MHLAFFCLDTKLSEHMDFNFPRNVRLIINVGEMGTTLYAIQAEMSATEGTLIPWYCPPRGAFGGGCR